MICDIFILHPVNKLETINNYEGRVNNLNGYERYDNGGTGTGTGGEALEDEGITGVLVILSVTFKQRWE